MKWRISIYSHSFDFSQGHKRRDYSKAHNNYRGNCHHTRINEWQRHCLEAGMENSSPDFRALSHSKHKKSRAAQDATSSIWSWHTGPWTYGMPIFLWGNRALGKSHHLPVTCVWKSKLEKPRFAQCSCPCSSQFPSAPCATSTERLRASHHEAGTEDRSDDSHSRSQPTAQHILIKDSVWQALQAATEQQVCTLSNNLVPNQRLHQS